MSCVLPVNYKSAYTDIFCHCLLLAMGIHKHAFVLPRAICQLCCCRLEEYHLCVLKVEEVQQNIHKMVSAWKYGASNIVFHTSNGRIPSNQTGNLSNKYDLNKSMNNSGLVVQSDVPDLRINSDIKTCKEMFYVLQFA
jgi:hypothetical protein